MFKKISVGLDGSESSIDALEYAAHLAVNDDAELVLVSVVEPIYSYSPLAMYPEGAPSYWPEIMAHMRENLESLQKQHLERLKEAYPDLKMSGVVKEGRASTVLAEVSADVDLVVIGHRGIGGVLSWVLGSTARELLDKCTSPVFVAKKEDYC